MATTAMWAIKSRLDHVINYALDPEKTKKDDKEIYQQIHENNIDENDSIDEKLCYVSSLNCSTHRTYKDMLFTKNQYGKKDGILGYHAYQSFKADEASPDKIHLIGVKLAEEMWGEDFEVIITTHTNTKCTHNHFVINSVSFKNGKKYHDCREKLALLRHTSDTLCQEYGLSVLEEKKTKRKKINYDNYYKKYVSSNNYYNTAKRDIDKAITMAYSYKDFQNILIKMGYEFFERYNKITVKRKPYKKNIRIERAFGTEYSIDNINYRIENTTAPRVPFIEAYNPNIKIKVYQHMQKQKHHGLYGLYRYYCYILHTYPKHYPTKILPPTIRLDVEKLNDITQQTRMLVKNKIDTYEKFVFFQDNVNNEIRELIGKKHNLWIKHNRTINEYDKRIIRSEIHDIDLILYEKRKEAKLCVNIANRLNDIKENIKEFEESERKEKIKNEF